MVTFNFKGKEYQIVPEESKVLTEPVRPAESLLRDFEYCKENGDYQKIKNRINKPRK